MTQIKQYFEAPNRKPISLGVISAVAIQVIYQSRLVPFQVTLPMSVVGGCLAFATAYLSYSYLKVEGLY